MKLLRVTLDQIRVLDEYEGGLGTFYRVNPSNVHPHVCLPEAYYNGDTGVLLFIDTNIREQRQLLYFLGEENADLQIYYKGITIYSDVKVRPSWLDDTEFKVPYS